ncbi:MAG: trypsin-like peptidase domain-containing protein [Phycisphaerales bacterium]|nr:trypsin-like peptidase domain-containing protein [Phycisphaerales bacterium]
MRKFVSITPAIIVLLMVGVMMFLAPSVIDRYSYAQQNARITLARNVLAEDDILRRIDRAIAAIGDSIEPTVVHIETIPNGQRFNENMQPMGSYSSGAGWIYNTEGYVITNAHVVKEAESVSVEFFNGRVVEGSVVGTDIYTDIAVIQVDPSHTTFPAMRASDRLPRVGERIFAFGSPFGFKFSMSEGIVSGLGRQAQGARIVGGYTNYIQTDAAVNPGNSGGPLVNTDGHVIGMNVAIATAASTVGSNPEDSGGDSAGISFAIPLGTIEPIVAQLIEHGSVSRGYLGIRYDSSRNGRIGVRTSDGRTAYGVMITSVEPDGPSQAAGILEGDIMMSVQGSPVTNAEALTSLISSQRAGEPIQVVVHRDGEFKELEVTLGQMEPFVLAQRLSQPIQFQLGAVFSSNERGAQIVRIWQGLPAALAGLETEDVVTEINGRPFSDLSSFYVGLADNGLLTGSVVELTVMRTDGSIETVRLQVR